MLFLKKDGKIIYKDAIFPKDEIFTCPFRQPKKCCTICVN